MWRPKFLYRKWGGGLGGGGGGGGPKAGEADGADMALASKDMRTS
jgi:hypothetical protein